MRIFQINLPTLDNNGAGIVHAHEKLQKGLCQAFGGYTVTEGQGAWMDNGKLYAEPVMVYQAAYDPHTIPADLLREMAQFTGKDAKQIAMFIVIDGEAEIIDIE